MGVNTEVGKTVEKIASLIVNQVNSSSRRLATEAVACLLGRKLGNGAFSTAVEIDAHPDLAFKIGYGHHAAGEVLSDAWVRYALFCMQRTHPNLPQILHLHLSQNFYIAVMPKYACAKKRIHYAERDTPDMYNFIQGLRMGLSIQRNYLAPASAGRSNPDYADGHALGADILAQCGGIEDTHEANFLWDTKNDRLVVTDPIYDETDNRHQDRTIKMLMTMDHPDVYKDRSVEKRVAQHVQEPRERISKDVSFLHGRGPVKFIHDELHAMEDVRRQLEVAKRCEWIANGGMKFNEVGRPFTLGEKVHAPGDMRCVAGRRQVYTGNKWIDMGPDPIAVMLNAV
jgi:hypothetical protein